MSDFDQIIHQKHLSEITELDKQNNLFITKSELGVELSLTLDSLGTNLICHLKEHIDPSVKQYTILFNEKICELIISIWDKSILKVDPGFSDTKNLIGWLNINDNQSDLGLPITYKVILGNTTAFGHFGESSDWSLSPEQAIQEATYDFVYQFANAQRGRPNRMCYQRRK